MPATATLNKLLKKDGCCRQDQLILQIITLFDRLLKQEQLDLRLTPYRVLATAPDHGFVQYIDSQPLRDVIAQWDSSIQVGNIVNNRMVTVPQCSAELLETL